MEAPRCTAKAKQTGERCKRRPIPGGRVCFVHGGGSPAVKAAAQRRLLEAVDPLITELLKLALDDDTEPRVRLAAIRDALDRAGLGPTRQLEVVTLEAIDQEIARLEAELRTSGA